MAKPQTSPTAVLGVNSKEALELFVSHLTTRYLSHANYFVFSLENTTAIEITVGPKDEEVSWILPKSLLTHHSKFFDAALNGTFAESNSRSVTMPEDNPDAFRLFVQWLYIGDIMIDDADEWLEAWVLGDKIGNIAFRNCAMSKLVNDHEHYCIDSTIVATVYRKSALGSKLRKWALDQVLFDSSKGGLRVDADDWVSVVETEPEFVADVAKATILSTGGEVKDPRAHLDSYLGE